MKIILNNGRIAAIAVIAVFLCTLVALPAAAETPSQLKIVSASPGGIWYTLGARYAQLLEKNIDGMRVTASRGGSVPNARNVNSGSADVGIIYADFAQRARAGKAPFREKLPNLRILATIAPGKLQVVVPEESDIHRLEDLRDKRINPTYIGAGTREVAKMVLAGVGITFGSIRANGGNVVGVGHNDGMNMMQNGQLDGLFFLGGAASHILSLSTNPGVHLLPIGGKTREAILALPTNKDGVYFKDEITSKMYDFIKDPVPTISVMQVFLVNKNLPDDLVYEMVKVLYENGNDLRTLFPGQANEVFKLEDAPRGGSIPFHEGAKRYFAEQGVSVN